ncbi:adhesion G-protein coupled receptor G4 [Cyclopterus lumpus]|uniref:adhesion G-protein coupled receptor G4 n=1 Tax=Cyclopterus lumpus TaxID=8103 RepID=UPI00148731BB|nr:adhesion G-protein coupled receptor G4 [Cyclopterus lumpus]
MIFLQTILHVFITVSLLSSPTTTKRGPRLSLWGEAADFTITRCSQWRLKPQVSIPALQELTVCFSMKFKTIEDSEPWTAFMYTHPEVQYAELGLGGRRDRLVVWLFGTEWTTPKINLLPSQWYSLCLTWTHTKDRPALYVDGNPVNITADSTPSATPSSCKLAPNGTLTLGTLYRLGNGNNNIPHTPAVGKLSLFRLWGRERSKQEVTSLNCTEGDLVKWERNYWDSQTCAPIPDPSLQCEWSVYEVTLMFDIIRSDGNDTEPYTARDIAQKWLREILPSNIYLPRVSVFEVTRSRKEDSLVKALHEDQLVHRTPSRKRFDCLVHVNVIPSLDVADVQNEMCTSLSRGYLPPSGQLQLLADEESIHTTPVESFSDVTISPTDVVRVTTTTFKTTTSITSTSTITRASTDVALATTLTTNPANISELFFEVKVNVSITGDCDPGRILSTWLNSSLPDDMMMVLDLQLLPKARRHHSKPPSNLSPSDGVFAPRVSRESCIFQVRVMASLSDSQEMEEQIRDRLLTPYNNGSISIATEDIQIRQILILKCNAETQQTRKGLFEWPDTSGGRNATLPCRKNPQRYATRLCKLCLSTHWMAPNMEDCHLVVETIPDLDHVEVTVDNALDVVQMIEGLLRNHSTLNYQELLTVLNKLQDVVNLSRVTPNLGQALINTISDILESDSNLLPFTNIILNITDALGDTMVGYQGSFTLVAPAIALSVVDVDPGQFNSLTFGVSSDRAGTKPEIFINRFPFNGTVAFISLPSALQHSFPRNSSKQSTPRVKFQFFGIPMLFQNSQKGQSLNTFVVSASVTNASSPIKDLDEDVKVTLHHLTPNRLHKNVQCVYWNFNKNNGQGGWDDYGCRTYNSSSDYTTCLCDHLTHFGVLLDVSRTPVDVDNEQILTIITYAGCGVSSLFLGITVLTYTAFEKLRRDYPSQILINLSLALLGLNLVFLVNSWLSSWGVYGLCVAVASTLHYFLLASFTWMGLEAVNMYFALVKVFNVYVPSYILKFCALGWGIPLVICILVLIVDREAYGSHLYTGAQQSRQHLDNTDNFCWLQDDVTFYVSVVAYAVLVFLFNIAVFVVVLIQIRHMRDNSPAGTRSGLMQDLKGVASLTLLLGLTWTFGFFTWGPGRVVLLYLFAGLNTLQGLFIFLFHCLMKENVRKQWRIHLCFGRFRLEEYSEWSNSASVGFTAKPKSNPPRALAPSVCSVKSSSTDSTSASSDSSQRNSSCKRPNLGLFVHSLALPRAQRSSSGPEALPPQRGMTPTPGWKNQLLSQQEQR